MVHDLGWGGGGFWAVIALFSFWFVLGGEHNFISKWKPLLVNEPTSEDRYHLDGMEMVANCPTFVNALLITIQKSYE